MFYHVSEDSIEDPLNKMVIKYHSFYIIALQKSLSTRMEAYEKNDGYILAAVLDPSFKLLWCKENNQNSKVNNILTSKLAAIMLISNKWNKRWTKHTVWISHKTTKENKENIFIYG